MARNVATVAPLLAIAAALLAACSPQEQCVWQNTGEYRTVSNLLEEVEGNLARGYAWDERPVTSTEWDECPRVVRGKDGQRDIITVPCTRRVTEMERFRVPIDPAAEIRKRDNLRARQQALRPNAEAAVRACKAAYPEDRA